MEIAVVDMKLSPDEFWDLSWYEWGLYANRLIREGERRKDEIEERRLHTGIIWATLLNTHSHRKQGDRVFKATDLFSGEKEEKVADFDFNAVVSQVEKRAKKKDGN